MNTFKPNPRNLTPAADGNFAESLNAHLGGWSAAMGLHFIHATGESVTAELEIGPDHRQAYGIVHGGVHSGVIETIASVGAALGRYASWTVSGWRGEPYVVSSCGSGREAARYGTPLDARQAYPSVGS